MPPAVLSYPRNQVFSAPQLLCSQDFTRNPFVSIDLAGTFSTRLNRFIDLGGIAIFFQE
jgi:hypothetical protein